MSALYSVDNLCVHIGGVAIVNDLSLSIAAGEIVALCGASGAGKSMAAMTPFGLSSAPLAQASGSAKLDGQELIGMDETHLRSIRAASIGFVFQQPLTAMTPHHSVQAHLIEAACQSGGAKPTAARLVEMLSEVGLSDPQQRLRQYPHQLSGGERQRVLIACALAHGPKLLIADEPVSALDAALRRDIMALLVRVCRERHMAMLIVSHDLAGIEQYADRMLLLENGRVIEAGRAADMVQSPQSDYGKKLMAATPRLTEALPPLGAIGGVILEAENINIRFARSGWRAGALHAVRDASLCLAQGETLALVGGSGSGKSTLGRAIMGIGKIDDGRILWCGDDLPKRGKRTNAQRAHMQCVFQDPLASIDPRWRVEDIIAEPLRFLRPEYDSASRRTIIERLLDEVGLAAKFAERKPATLSGGQAQRVAIARTLSVDPALLLLDEATSALDPLVAGEICGLLSRLQKSRGLSMLLITHDLALARRMAHHIAVMDQGEIVETATRKMLFSHPQAEATKRLIAASV